MVQRLYTRYGFVFISAVMTFLRIDSVLSGGTSAMSLTGRMTVKADPLPEPRLDVDLALHSFEDSTAYVEAYPSAVKRTQNRARRPPT